MSDRPGFPQVVKSYQNMSRKIAPQAALTFRHVVGFDGAFLPQRIGVCGGRAIRTSANHLLRFVRQLGRDEALGTRCRDGADVAVSAEAVAGTGGRIGRGPAKRSRLAG
jgi:hypothetical protein